MLKLMETTTNMAERSDPFEWLDCLQRAGLVVLGVVGAETLLLLGTLVGLCDATSTKCIDRTVLPDELLVYTGH